MQAIIYKRREAAGESLLLDCLTEEGFPEKFRIPGVLKSKKRNSFFMSPATIWDFTLTNHRKEVHVPREHRLIFSPFDVDVAYQTLLDLNEAMKPLHFLRPQMESRGVFKKTRDMLMNWASKGSSVSLNRFYLDFLEEMGLLHWANGCVHCGHSLDEAAVYHLFSGSTCSGCLRGMEIREEEKLSNEWIYRVMTSGNSSDPQDKLYRERIQLYLKSIL